MDSPPSPNTNTQTRVAEALSKLSWLDADEGSALSPQPVVLPSRLHGVIEDGNAPLLRSMFKSNADPNELDGEGISALHAAADLGDNECITELLNARASVTSLDADSCNPIHVASRNGYSDVLGQLLEAKADVDAGNNQHCTALHMSAERGHIDCVTMLLEAGAAVDGASRRLTRDAIFGAVVFDVSTAIADSRDGALLECGSKGAAVGAGAGPILSDQDSVEYSVIAAGRSTDSTDFGLGFGYGFTDNSTSNDVPFKPSPEHPTRTASPPTRTPSHLLPKQPEAQPTSAFLPAPKPKPTVYFPTPLQLATVFGHAKVLKALIDAKARLDCIDDQGRSPVHVAACEGHDDCLNLLLDALGKSAANSADTQNWTPLQHACIHAHADCCNTLLVRGAVRDTISPKGVPALVLAAMVGARDCVEVLRKDRDLERLLAGDLDPHVDGDADK